MKPGSFVCAEPRQNARIVETSSFSGDPARKVTKKRWSGSMNSIIPAASLYGLFDWNSASPRGAMKPAPVKSLSDCGFTASKIATGAAR